MSNFPQRKSLALPAIIAFFFCIITRPFLKEISDIGIFNFGCRNLIPKIAGLVGKFPEDQLCDVNNYFLISFIFILLSYTMAISVSIFFNRDVMTLDIVRKSPLKELLLLTFFLVAPGAFALYKYLFGDLSVRIYGGPVDGYISLRDYAESQINILMYAVNLLLFVPSTVMLVLFIKREHRGK